MNKENEKKEIERVQEKIEELEYLRMEDTFSFKKKLEEAEILLEYSINRNLEVSDEILKAMATLNSIEKHSSNDVFELSKVIRDLTSVTFPATIESIKASSISNPNRQLWILISIAVPSLVFAIMLGHQDSEKVSWAPSGLAVCLGLLGSIVNVFFHVIGVMKERVVTLESKWESSIRIVLGGILGWLLYFSIRPDLSLVNQLNEPNLIVLAPFLAGFSTQLVFGVLNQSIKAVEITLGIKDSSTEILKRSGKASKKNN